MGRQVCRGDTVLPALQSRFGFLTAWISLLQQNFGRASPQWAMRYLLC